MPSSSTYRGLWVGLLALACGIVAVPALAKPVTANRLLPKHTLAYVRIADVSQLIERFQQTSTGRMLQDPQMKPVVDNVYGVIRNATAEMKNELGVSLDDLARLPRGEITFAVVSADAGPPVLVLMAHVGDEVLTARKLIERAEAELEKANGKRSEEIVDDTKLVLYERPNIAEPFAAQFEKDGTLVFATDPRVAKQILKDWTRGAEESLSENQQFASIMRACRGSRDEPPQIAWFVDPIGLVREFMQANTAAQTALALLPVLGLDGLKGLGGSFIMAEGDFDVISHLHVLLDDPRSGVLDLIALESGDSTPPRWVPGDVAAYTTFHWNFQETYKRLAKLVDSFQGQGFTEQRAKGASEQFLGIDLVGQVLPVLEGRVTVIGWVGRPATEGGAANLVALHVKDAAAAEEILEKIVARRPEVFEKKSYGGVSYQAIKVPPQAGANRPFGTPTPCLAVLEDCLMFTDNVRLLEHVIVSKEDTSKSLATALDFKLIASKVSRQAGGAKPALLRFERPEEGLRFLYEFANSDAAKRGLKSGGENNKFLKALGQTMEENPLPPFAVIAKYFAPGGGMAVDDETGIHIVSFTLRRE